MKLIALYLLPHIFVALLALDGLNINVTMKVPLL